MTGSSAGAGLAAERHRITGDRDPATMRVETKNHAMSGAAPGPDRPSARARRPVSMAAPMERAFIAARRAGARGEVPVGAVVTNGFGDVLAARGNAMRRNTNACAHAEILAMRMAARRVPPAASPGRLEGCDLWVTLEPCAMCAMAAGIFRVRRILFAAYDPKGGGIEHGLRVFAGAPPIHRPEIIGGIREIESRTMLQDFFRDLRGKVSGSDTIFLP